MFQLLAVLAMQLSTLIALVVLQRTLTVRRTAWSLIITMWVSQSEVHVLALFVKVLKDGTLLVKHAVAICHLALHRVGPIKDLRLDVVRWALLTKQTVSSAAHYHREGRIGFTAYFTLDANTSERSWVHQWWRHCLILAGWLEDLRYRLPFPNLDLLELPEGLWLSQPHNFLSVELNNFLWTFVEWFAHL